MGVTRGSSEAYIATNPKAANDIVRYFFRSEGEDHPQAMKYQPKKYTFFTKEELLFLPCSSISSNNYSSSFIGYILFA